MSMFVLFCPPLVRWEGASHTRKKMSEPFRILSEGTWLPSLLTSSKQPNPRGEISLSSSLIYWKSRRLTRSHTSLTWERKSLLTTNRTLSKHLCLLLLLPWQHLLYLEKYQCQVHSSHTYTHANPPSCPQVHCIECLVVAISCSYWVLYTSFMVCIFPNAPVCHRVHGTGNPIECTCHMDEIHESWQWYSEL